MADILQKKKYKRILYSKQMLAFLLIALFFVGRATWGIYEKKRETAEKLAAVRSEHAELQERHETISEDVERLQTERGVEQEIRERFGVAKEGEQVVYVVEEEAATSTDAQEKERAWWQRLFGFFGIE